MAAPKIKRGQEVQDAIVRGNVGRVVAVYGETLVMESVNMPEYFAELAPTKAGPNLKPGQFSRHISEVRVA